MTRCGSQVPQPILTSDSYAHVKFVSNNANTFPGFQLKFEASVEGKNWHEMKENLLFNFHVQLTYTLFLRIYVNMECTQ